MNVAGAAVGYSSYKHQEFNRYVDFRIEYWPTFTKYDMFTDYQGLKYLAAFKLSSLSNRLRGLELHAGYYARGYETRRIDAQRRVLYAAIGVNLFELLARFSIIGPPHKVLSYVQLPYTYLEYTNELNP